MSRYEFKCWTNNSLALTMRDAVTATGNLPKSINVMKEDGQLDFKVVGITSGSTTHSRGDVTWDVCVLLEID